MARLAAALWGLALSSCAVVTAGINHPSSLRPPQPARSFIQTLKFKHVLRICNAYPFTSALDIYTGSGTVKLTNAPLPYKQCQDFTPMLHAGDRIDFKVGDTDAGTFTISDLPNGDATLLMVIYRHDPVSTAVAFESHVFNSVGAAQVAVMDTYKGPAKSEVRIQDATHTANATSVPRNEILRFDSVVAVDPGAYEVTLEGASANGTQAKTELVALPQEAYVVIRVGVKAEYGPEYPEDVIVFPNSPKAALGAASRTQFLSIFVAIACITAALSAGRPVA